MSQRTTGPLELVSCKTVCTTQTMATELVRRLAMLGASSKMSTPLLPGWYVWLSATRYGRTVRWQMLAEPEADVQSDAPPF